LFKLIFFCVGKHKMPYVEQGILDYEKRLYPFCKCEWQFVREMRASSSNEKESIAKESELLVGKLAGSKAHHILLDIKGKAMASDQFAHWLQGFVLENRVPAFIIGGAAGVDLARLQPHIHDRLSLSGMTFNHVLVRLMLMEQLYRAYTIIVGKPYHK